MWAHPPNLGFFIGDGRAQSSRRAWRKLPTAYQRCVSYSDFWRAYSCLLATTHQMVGKETGQPAHIERLHNTLRQRISRLVRKTLSFSKREYRFNLHFKLFAYFYTLGSIDILAKPDQRTGKIDKT